MLEQLPAIWTWDAVSEVEAYPPDPEDYSWARMQVRGDCGLLHESAVEWGECQVCMNALIRARRICGPGG